jgi:hypothetical protein
MELRRLRGKMVTCCWIFCVIFVISICIDICNSRKLKKEVETFLASGRKVFVLFDKAVELLDEMEEYITNSESYSCSGKFHEIVERWREAKR